MGVHTSGCHVGSIGVDCAFSSEPGGEVRSQEYDLSIAAGNILVGKDIGGGYLVA